MFTRQSLGSVGEMLQPASPIRPSLYVHSFPSVSINRWAIFPMVVPILRVVLNAVRATSAIQEVSWSISEQSAHIFRTDDQWHLFVTILALNTKEKTRKLRRWMRPIIVIIIAVTALLIIITVVVTCAVYRFCRKKSKDPYGPVATKEPEISLDTLKNKINKKRSQQSTADNYPEECATPWICIKMIKLSKTCIRARGYVFFTSVTAFLALCTIIS